MKACKWLLICIGVGLVGVWCAEDAESRCRRRYRCFTKKYCDLKPTKRKKGKRKYAYRCNYRRYCKYYRVCKRRPPPPPPPPPPPGDDMPVMDFHRKQAAPQIPRARLQAIVKQRLPQVFDCFKKELRKDKRFTGAKVVFTIRGDKGRVGRVSFEDADKPYRRLARCIRRASRRWRFPRFNGSAFVVYPIFVRAR